MIKHERLILFRPAFARWRVAVPVDIQQFPVRDDFRVKFDLQSFRVVTDIVICRIICGAACITYPGSDNAVKAPEPGIGSPESAKSKGCRI